MRVFDHIDYGVRVLTGILMGIMTTLVLIDVFWRYVLNSPLGWPQEVSVMCMVMIVMLGTATAVRKRSHIAITMLVDAVPPGLKRVMVLFGYGVQFIVFFLVATQGWTVAVRAMRQLSTITGIPQGYVAGAVPVCGVLCMVYILEQAWLSLRAGKEAKADA
jgi:TRAP-type C4-dicarboxylate transport system permease small subunit